MDDPPELIPLLMLLIRDGTYERNVSGTCGSCAGCFLLYDPLLPEMCSP